MSIKELIIDNGTEPKEEEHCDGAMEMDTNSECLELLKYIADELHEIHLILKPAEPKEPVEEIVSFNERR